MTSSEPLKSLSEPVRTRLRSTQLLISLPQVVSELVQNSLDASASHIEIGVDCQEWECWVKDDGHGIARNGLDALSKSLEAGRYCMSFLVSQRRHFKNRLRIRHVQSLRPELSDRNIHLWIQR